MSDIKADELYDRLVSYGMFSEKLPPVFTGELFWIIVKTFVSNHFQMCGEDTLIMKA